MWQVTEIGFILHSVQLVGDCSTLYLSAMKCKMIEAGTYDELCALRHCVCERVDYLSTVRSHKPDK